MFANPFLLKLDLLMLDRYASVFLYGLQAKLHRALTPSAVIEYLGIIPPGSLCEKYWQNGTM